MLSAPFNTRLTVPTDTPAWRAMSEIVAVERFIEDFFIFLKIQNIQ
jgi:hypothetical protein